MKLGFLTACLPKLKLEDLVKWASQEGFQSLELASWPVKSKRDYQARQIDAANFKPADAERINALFNEHNLTISSLAYYDNNLHPNLKKRKEYHDHLKKVINTASMLGVNLVGTFVGGRPDKSPTDNMKEIGKVFRTLVKYAEDKGVRLMIENCPMEGWLKFATPGNYAYSPELWTALFNEVPSDSFGLNLDPSHLYWLGIDYLEVIKDFKDKIFHAHAKDTEILTEGQYEYGFFGRQIDPIPWKSGWWRYRIPGLGEIDWNRFISTLQDNGYNYVISIEHEDPVWEGSEEKVKNGLKLGQRHLSPFVI
ncbi:MAG: sugar phosphate isomerase/epimerase [Ignavibacteria bacterium]|jgi:sugar phosphate isomerase/epimerase|nr:sugar phosphate isomerase/epimerase [Ignavibacteria bacterium]MCU7500064.1 sugar phosphate isomerase/epimerase [Ignavibacteria bacterium]MCU7512790.1 sugar phosphate isomerase/epimerase [Ignavibacteria bacterium]MCU7521798.1 sugar phosphate isomerase/epimerase [Ignavibacteria bacterium]MCU7524847.1 sugar phosphate isomerase/epimerase [Ignavibacteria bacterium]